MTRRSSEMLSERRCLWSNIFGKRCISLGDSKCALEKQSSKKYFLNLFDHIIFKLSLTLSLPPSFSSLLNIKYQGLMGKISENIVLSYLRKVFRGQFLPFSIIPEPAPCLTQNDYSIKVKLQ